MELHKITEDLSVASQLDAADVPLIAAKGFRAIVCNRPDGEATGQPSFGPVEDGRSRRRNGGCLPAGPVRCGQRCGRRRFRKAIGGVAEAGACLLPDGDALHGSVGAEPGSQTAL